MIGTTFAHVRSNHLAKYLVDPQDINQETGQQVELVLQSKAADSL